MASVRANEPEADVTPGLSFIMKPGVARKASMSFGDSNVGQMGQEPGTVCRGSPSGGPGLLKGAGDC